MEGKPSFNQQQIDYLHDTSFLLNKRIISQHIQELLATTERKLVEFVENKKPDGIPDGSLVGAGKISRGENYRGLPYQVLDYPRLFKQESIFTFRTMFWWGNFFSCTLHLQGEVFDRHRKNIQQNLLHYQNRWPDTYIGIHNTSPWEYHYGKDNYQLLQHLDEHKIASFPTRKFLKISRKIPLSQYQKVPAFALQSFQDFLAFISIPG